MKADFRMFFSAFSDSDRSRKPSPWSILLLSTPSACSVLEPGPTPSPWSILFLFKLQQGAYIVHCTILYTCTFVQCHMLTLWSGDSVSGQSLLDHHTSNMLGNKSKISVVKIV